jgi:multiple sugar transport system permease protein
MAQNVMRQNQNVLSYRAMKRRETFAAYGFILPTLVGFLLFVLGPMLASFLLSMYDWNLLTPPVFVGLGNWQQLFADARIGGIYLTTAKLSLMVVFCNMTLGLTLAVLLDRKMPHLLRNFFRISYFFPYVVSGVAVSLIWTFLFNRDLGPLNYYLTQLGFAARINWLNSSQWSPLALVIADVWKNVGFYVLVFLGGMQAISRDYYEAAEVDGATGWQQFRKITLPLLSPTILFLLVISVIGALQIFEQPQILTNGGPGDATRTIVLYIYEQGFKFFDMGYAATIALSLFVIILILTIIQFRLSRRWVFYQ